MTYVDWEYYSSLYDNITEAEFMALNTKASHRLDRVTHYRAEQFERRYSEESATDFERCIHSQVKDTVCELINQIHAQEVYGLGTGVVSVSNDGYSESYAVTGRKQAEEELTGIIRRGLSGTGLAGAL